jgi:hypothetical protein
MILENFRKIPHQILTNYDPKQPIGNFFLQIKKENMKHRASWSRHMLIARGQLILNHIDKENEKKGLTCGPHMSHIFV